MNYSIIVPTCNRQPDLVKLIDSILKQTLLPAEVIIVDQSDNDDTKKYIDNLRNQLLSESNNINLIYIYQNEKNSAAARNKGIDITTGEIVSFLDDDVVLFEDYYEKVLRYFNEDKKIGGVSGKVIVKKFTGWGMRMLLKVFLLNNFEGKITVSGFGFPISLQRFDIPKQVEMFMGCNMNFRKEFLKNDKFDEWFTGYSYREDVEFSYRMSQKTVLMMIPEAKLYHNYSRSNRMDIQEKKIMQIKNFYYVYKKYAKKTVLSDFLFFYSLFGLFTIALKEYLCIRDKETYKQLKGFIIGIIELLKHKNTILKK